MYKFMQTFVRITGVLPYLLIFRTKVYYQKNAIKGSKLKGPAIVYANHTSLYDFAQMLFLFPFRFIRCLMAELLFKKPVLGPFLKSMGGLEVQRDSHDFSFLHKTDLILEKGGLVCAFPEARIPKEGEALPLPFKPSTAYIALKSGAPLIPVYSTGDYFCKQKNYVIIGEPIYVEDIFDNDLTEKENVEKINTVMRNKIIEMENELKERINQGKKGKKA